MTGRKPPKDSDQHWYRLRREVRIATPVAHHQIDSPAARKGGNMPSVLVIYHSRTGHTELMATTISDAIRTEGLDVICKRVEEAELDELLHVDGLVIGSPTYFGTMAAEIKSFLDKSIKHHRRLDGKVGAAFASSGSTGQETTVLSILQALMTHGMIIQGDCRGLHYGATSVGEQPESHLHYYQRFGQRFANLVKRVSASSPAETSSN